MKNIRKFLSSPWFLSLIPLAVVIALTAGKFSRFVLETETAGILDRGHYVYYDDIDNDGVFEKLHAANQDNSTALAISVKGDILNQWNFSGSFDFFMVKCLFITGDKEGDGKKEVYVFTLAGDSVLLHCISDYSDTEPSFTDRFIVKVGKGLKKPDPFIIPAEMQDLDGDGVKELIFGVSTGFSKYPRNVFAYYIEKDSLIMSPESYYYIQEIMQHDVTGDGKKEIIPFGYATGNVEPEEAVYHDYSSFLMVLDQHLRFLFPPVEFKEEFSAVSPVKNLTEGDSLLPFIFAPRSIHSNSVIYRINQYGNIVDSVELSTRTGDAYRIKSKSGKINYLTLSPFTGIALYSQDYNIRKELSDYDNSEFFLSDLDNDGLKEFIVISFFAGRITILRDGLRHKVSANFSTEGNSNQKLNSMMGNKISLQSGQHQTIFRYRRNPLYPYFYLIYVLTYAGILAFSILVRESQKRQMQMKYDNEKKISELQLALIKNQLDPHFTLNAINSIIYSAEYSDRTKTGDQLRAFAGLYRNMLLSATSVQRTIREELDFCRNYLELEKMRFGNGLNYEIYIPEDVDLNISIPKFSIQIHAENAIKHGLTPVVKGAMLRIVARNEGSDTIIEISDNGSGRKAAMGESTVSTGKGLKIMNELFGIYNKYYSEKVNSEIIDLYNDRNEPSGTLVRITIRKVK